MNKRSKTYQSILPHYQAILEGNILAVDPSTGSQSSMPGYAWFEKGELKESGIFQIDTGMNRSKRLYEISRTIREEFPTPDGLLVEYIPPVRYGRGGMNTIALMALQKAVGAIIASHPYEVFIEVPTSAWLKHKPSNYKKTDEWDAICIGLCVVNTALEIKKEIDKKENS